MSMAIDQPAGSELWRGENTGESLIVASKVSEDGIDGCIMNNRPTKAREVYPMGYESPLQKVMKKVGQIGHRP